MQNDHPTKIGNPNLAARCTGGGGQVFICRFISSFPDRFINICHEQSTRIQPTIDQRFRLTNFPCLLNHFDAKQRGSDLKLKFNIPKPDNIVF